MFPIFNKHIVLLKESAKAERLMEEIDYHKAHGMSGGVLLMTFYQRHIQPLRERVHPLYEHMGGNDGKSELKSFLPWMAAILQASRVLHCNDQKILTFSKHGLRSGLSLGW